MAATYASLLQKARKGGYAIGGFNINNMEIAQAVVEAAQELKSPVILQTSEGALDYAGVNYLAAIAWTANHISDVPVLLHLDHGKDVEVVKWVIKSGLYNSVMFDGSHLPFKENVKVTRQIVKMAHKRGMHVEAELGPIPGTEDKVSVSNADAFFTDPDQAAEFVKATECDSLAVSVGTAHGANKAKGIAGKIDMVRLGAIADMVSVPLVLHGASTVEAGAVKKFNAGSKALGGKGLKDAHGISWAQKKKAITLGVSKVNIDTDLRLAFAAELHKTVKQKPNEFDPRKMLGPTRAAMKKVVAKAITQMGSKGKA